MSVAWSFGLLFISTVHLAYATPLYFGLGTLVGLRFYFQRDVDSDRLSYAYYNVCTFILDNVCTFILDNVFMSLTLFLIRLG
jgi:hypothetical protein